MRTNTTPRKRSVTVTVRHFNINTTQTRNMTGKRTYTHCVIVTIPGPAGGEEGAASFHTSEALAHRAAADLQGYYGPAVHCSVRAVDGQKPCKPEAKPARRRKPVDWRSMVAAEAARKARRRI